MSIIMFLGNLTEKFQVCFKMFRMNIMVVMYVRSIHAHTHTHTNTWIYIHIYSYMNRMVCSWHRLYNCICYFCFCCRKSRLRKQRSFLAQSDLYSREAEGRAEAAVHVAALVRRQRAAHWACSHLFPFPLIYSWTPIHGLPDSGRGFLPQLSFSASWATLNLVRLRIMKITQQSYTNTSWCRFPPASSDCFGVSTGRTGRVSEGPLS